METYSDFLFAKPSYWEGLARIVDFGNTLNEYNAFPSGERADAIAMWMDWRMVGLNLRDAMRVYVKEIERESPIPSK